jgi:hypothetical protein
MWLSSLKQDLQVVARQQHVDKSSEAGWGTHPLPRQRMLPLQTFDGHKCAGNSRENVLSQYDLRLLNSRKLQI